MKRPLAPTRTPATKSWRGLKWLSTRVLQLFGPNLFSRQGSQGLFHPLRVLVDNIIARHPPHCSSSFQEMFTAFVYHSLTRPSVVLVYHEAGIFGSFSQLYIFMRQRLNNLTCCGQCSKNIFVGSCKEKYVKMQWTGRRLTILQNNKSRNWRERLVQWPSSCSSRNPFVTSDDCFKVAFVLNTWIK